VVVTHEEGASPGSYHPGIPFELAAPEGFDDVTFDLVSIVPKSALFSMNGQTGINAFYVKGDSGNERFDEKATVQATTVYWIANLDFAKGTKLDQVYITVVIRSGEHIIGYSVLQVVTEKQDTSRLYWIKEIDGQLYPKVDGNFQDVTQDYVDQQMKKAMK
jgi:hypothetical protein